MLVIDDEADQASLNNLIRQGALSTTYQFLSRLKSVIPHHTFLQYTATPQGNLLLNLIDVLSASFAVVLEPGPDYVGGSTFFARNSPYVRLILPQDIPSDQNPIEEAPHSLREALQLFFVGAASGYRRKDSRPPRRSMMVHPTREKIGHRQYFQWIQGVRGLWEQVLALPYEDPDRVALENQFREAHQELTRSEPNLEPFDQLRLLYAIRQAEVRVINSNAAVRKINWHDNYAWILVGGQMLDRGFTVEGLTITYMPRGPGVGYADTIQQRARFLGYKRPYLGFCRAYLEQDVLDSYRVYVTHEEHLRKRLSAHIQSGKPLQQFRRVFLLDSSLRPTRPSVYDVDYVRPQIEQGFIYPRSPNPDDSATNAAVIASFVRPRAASFIADEGHADRTAFQKHLVSDIANLREIYDELLLPYKVSNFEDSQAWIALMEMIAVQLEPETRNGAPEPAAAVVQMRPTVTTRRATTAGKIDQLFQGAHPDHRGEIYPGDRGIHPCSVSVQVHYVTLTEGPVVAGNVLAESVPVLAVWLDRDLRLDVVVQDQDGP